MVTRRQLLTGFGAAGAAGAAGIVSKVRPAFAQYNEQRVSPDTCSCVYVESWDTSIPDDQRIYALVAIEHRGPEHAAILDDSLYGIVREENRRKNLAQQFAMALTGLVRDSVEWSFDAGRTLHISFPGINVPVNLRQQIQDWCDTNLGLAKVVVE